MLDLLLAILSSAAVSAMLRIGERRTSGMYGRFAMNYLSGAILVISLIGVAAFRERSGKRQWCGLAIILVALVLLDL